MQLVSYQTAYVREGENVRIRVIRIPSHEADGASQEQLLDLAFHYGQNDFQPQGACHSVSVGDVVQLPDESLHMVAPVGFKALPAGTDLLTFPRGRDAREAAR